jgi:hypothetical protein
MMSAITALALTDIERRQRVQALELGNRKRSILLRRPFSLEENKERVMAIGSDQPRPKMPGLPLDDSFYEGLDAFLKTLDWRYVDPMVVNHQTHAVLNAMLRKFSNEWVSIGGQGRPMPDKWRYPEVLIECTCTATRTCDWCRR